MSKLPKSPVETAETLESATEVADVALQAALRCVRDDIVAASRAPIGSPERDQVPRMAAQVVAISCELRKASKAQDAAVRDLTHATVLTWARLQTREARARLVAAVDAVDNPNRRSVLG